MRRFWLAQKKFRGKHFVVVTRTNHTHTHTSILALLSRERSLYMIIMFVCSSVIAGKNTCVTLKLCVFKVAQELKKKFIVFLDRWRRRRRFIIFFFSLFDHCQMSKGENKRNEYYKKKYLYNIQFIKSVVVVVAKYYYSFVITHTYMPVASRVCVCFALGCWKGRGGIEGNFRIAPRV